MDKLKELIRAYVPWDEQEEKDRKLILDFMEGQPDCLERSNEIAHFTASAWVLNPGKDRVLMVYHNLYDSWSWTGGHADGEEDLLEVAIREVGEETGLTRLAPVSESIYSLEIITVDGHWKKGRYVSSHLHLNLTWLLEALEEQELCSNPEENSGVRWMGFEEAVESSSEPWMRRVYRKLNAKLDSWIG